MPNLLEDYDVLGFDADHCLVKYHVRELMLLVARIQGEDLHKKGGYPAEIADFDPSQIDICLNNAVWDIKTGNLLKLLEGGIVARACHGFKPLSQAEIEATYGSPPRFETLNYPQTTREFGSSEHNYWVLMTYFDCCKIPNICRGVELVD